MGSKKIDTLLNDYADVLRKQREVTDLYDNHQAALEEQMPVELRGAIEALAHERARWLDEIQSDLMARSTEIKRLVTPGGASVKTDRIQAVYTPGRPLWDDSMLQGYAMDHPEILKARHVGEPSVSLRPVKTKE